MPKRKVLTKEVRFMIENELEKDIKAVMQLENITQADLARKAIREYVDNKLIERVSSKIEIVMRKQMENRLKGMEDRLITRINKATKASVTTKFLQLATIQEVHKSPDVKKINDFAEKNAIAYLQSKDSLYFESKDEAKNLNTSGTSNE